MHGLDGFLGGGFMWIFWIILIIVILYIVKDVVSKGSSSSTGSSSADNDPIEILKRRYAKGEIDEAEYERRKRELEK